MATKRTTTIITMTSFCRTMLWGYAVVCPKTGFCSAFFSLIASIPISMVGNTQASRVLLNFPCWIRLQGGLEGKSCVESVDL